MKQIVLFIIILVLIGGGFFYWWQNQADVRELNKGFSEDEKIVKDFFGTYWFVQKVDGEEIKMIKIEKENDQYRITNRQYDYEFILPEDREGLWRLEYLEFSGKEDMEYICKICTEGSILYVGMIGGKGDNMTIESYKLEDRNTTLDEFIRNGSPIWLYKMDIEEKNINGIDVIIASREYGTKDERGRYYNYFFRGKLNFYNLEHVSEEFIDYLIFNGKW